ncbi:MAG: preprotein translocase subunit SecG [Deltaproteobacteria bacterium RIFCSPLOWO2_02_FULL_44_10]|nr:MAG: preprotein translocase subunit SecG [Deltaproteobacteria bacterium RIFCSPHIGHO2_02_FULL_44_16]OGQ47228.1 MAG: preprotein translocase subunit SecG [Deltaproteobacteria bacterium RIFCSPLOWO2_02_FULL_44_10]
METLLLIVHFFLCFFLIGVILLQSGKGASIGASFGGGASQTLFGSRGPTTFLNKLTTIVAILFLATSVFLAQITKDKGSRSILDKVVLPEETRVIQPEEEKTTGETSSETTPATPKKSEEKPQ